MKDVNRENPKDLIANTLAQLKSQAAEQFIKSDMPDIYLDDGTEVEDDEYFQTCARNTEFIAVFAGERWIVSHSMLDFVFVIVICHLPLCYSYIDYVFLYCYV